jgi:hypothetical protein
MSVFTKNVWKRKKKFLLPQGLLPTSCSRPRLAHYVGSLAAWTHSTSSLALKKGNGGSPKFRGYSPNPKTFIPPPVRGTDEVHDRVHVEK